MANPERTTSPRPESTIVQNFAADLDDMFGLDSGLSGLSQTVNEKKQTLSTKDRELQELEARIRETEERLARASRNASPARSQQQQQPPQSTFAGAQQRSSSPTTQSSSSSNTQALPTHLASERQPHPFAQRPTYPEDRPPTQRQDTQTLMSGMPGALPQTPVRGYSGSSEYVMVDGGARARGNGTSV